MASTTASETPAVPAAAAPKKTRLNPARRKAASKVKAESQSPAPTSTVQAASKDASTPAPPPATKPVANSTPVPNKLSRTKTTPAPVQQIPSQPQTTTPPPKPTLTRARTTPNPNPHLPRTKSALALSAPALVTGSLVGCAAGAALLLGVGIWYDFSGPQSALLAARAAKVSFDNLADEVIASLKTGTYSTDEALDMLRRTSLAYADAVPGGRVGVERVFREVEMVRKVRGREVEGLVGETFAVLGRAGRRGAGREEMRGIVAGQLGKLAGVGGRAAGDVVGRNPGLRPFGVEAGRGLGTEERRRGETVRVNLVVKQKGGK